MMCAHLAAHRMIERSTGGSIELNERVFDWILRRYETSLGWVLRHQPLIAAGDACRPWASPVYLYVNIPKGFFPQQDTGADQRLDSRRPEYFVSGHAQPHNRS